VKLLLGDIDGAEVDFQKALKLNAKNANAHFNMATILIERRRLEEAAYHCRQALGIDPECFEAHLNLGRILVDTGPLEEGIQHLTKALELRPDDSLALYHCAVANEKRGEIGLAATHYERALKNQPDLVQALVSLASIRATTRQYDARDGKEAVVLAEKAADLTKHSDPWALDVLAAAYAEAGRFPEALRTARTAMQLALAKGDQLRARVVQQRLELYQQREPFRRSTPFDP
jgi:tetratricopeptide (TPR) repeat protein